MACCTDIQDNCLKVVTIDYLKTFIGTNIQDSSGNAVTISRTDGTYCPTYGELTNGSIIPYWSQGTTPNGDTDGIIVNRIWTGDGVTAYKSNQLVDQKDLSLRYTRFSGLTISAAKTTNISECGESISVSYSHKYVRNTKSMNDSCTVPVNPSTAETSDTACGELSWHTDFYNLINSGSSVSNCNTYTIGKNGKVSALTRTDNVYATVIFRGTSHNSNTLQMRQNALTGSYSVADSNNPHYTGVTASTNDATNYNDCSSHNFCITATGGFYNRYFWKENVCNVTYYDIYEDTPGTEDVGGGATSCSISGPSIIYCQGTADFTVSSGSGGKAVKCGSFDSVDCCDGGTSEQRILDVNYHDFTDSITFTRTCPSCAPCTPPEPKPYPTDNTSSMHVSASKIGDSVCDSITVTGSTNTVSIASYTGDLVATIGNGTDDCYGCSCAGGVYSTSCCVKISINGRGSNGIIGTYTISCSDSNYQSGYTVTVYLDD